MGPGRGGAGRRGRGGRDRGRGGGADSWPGPGRRWQNPGPEPSLDAALAAHVFHRALLVSDEKSLRALLAELREHESAEELVERALVPAMAKLGAEWAQGIVAAEVVASAARTAEFVADLLAPPPAGDPARGPLVALASLDEVHTLGKKLVARHLAAAGMRVLDLGAGLPPATLAEQAAVAGAAVLLASATMVRSALQVSELAACARAAAGLRVGVGGAPFRLDESLWRSVGADGAAAAAHQAPALVARLLATAG